MTRYSELDAYETAQAILGPPGRMLTLSKENFERRHPTRAVAFNANVCTRAHGKVWFGDIDLTREDHLLAQLAAILGEAVYVIRERDARFASEGAPLFECSVFVVRPDGTTDLDASLTRGRDGRLRRATGPGRP